MGLKLTKEDEQITKMSKGKAFVLGAISAGAAVGFFNQNAFGFGTTFMIIAAGMLIYSFVNFMMDGGK